MAYVEQFVAAVQHIFDLSKNYYRQSSNHQITLTWVKVFSPEITLSMPFCRYDKRIKKWRWWWHYEKVRIHDKMIREWDGIHYIQMLIVLTHSLMSKRKISVWKIGTNVWRIVKKLFWLYRGSLRRQNIKKGDFQSARWNRRTFVLGDSPSLRPLTKHPSTKEGFDNERWCHVLAVVEGELQQNWSKTYAILSTVICRFQQSGSGCKE